ncbi:invasion associated locus B family protein [Arsukibacterium sp.]|uniref:invasion associated locus B family protein n=1 Tax=Arsukibacterium sp. TaxID=1977258 RepID=UPI003567DE28
MATIKFQHPLIKGRIQLVKLAGLALLSSLLSQTVSADTSKATVEAFGDWRSVCNEQCVIAQGLQNPENPDIIYSSQVAYVTGSSDPVLQLNLPLGIYLPPGVAIDIGENKHRAPVTVCLPQGCKVLLVLSPQIIRQLQQNAAYTVKVFVTEQTPRQLKFSLRGFTEALASLTTKNEN